MALQDIAPGQITQEQRTRSQRIRTFFTAVQFAKPYPREIFLSVARDVDVPIHTAARWA